jgi:hypothetical protein
MPPQCFRTVMTVPVPPRTVQFLAREITAFLDASPSCSLLGKGKATRRVVCTLFAGRSPSVCPYYTASSKEQKRAGEGIDAKQVRTTAGAANAHAGTRSNASTRARFSVRKFGPSPAGVTLMGRYVNIRNHNCRNPA